MAPRSLWQLSVVLLAARWLPSRGLCGGSHPAPGLTFSRVSDIVAGMSSLLHPLVARIRAIPSAQWEDLARMAGCAKSLPRKLACGDRANPRVQTIQPLVDYFARVDRGEAALPGPRPIVVERPAVRRVA